MHKIQAGSLCFLQNVPQTVTLHAHFDDNFINTNLVEAISFGKYINEVCCNQNNDCYYFALIHFNYSQSLVILKYTGAYQIVCTACRVIISCNLIHFVKYIRNLTHVLIISLKFWWFLSHFYLTTLAQNRTLSTRHLFHRTETQTNSCIRLPRWVLIR